MKTKWLPAIVSASTMAALVLLEVPLASAQFGGGSLRGTIRDEQGLALPGVTVTATSEDLITPRTTVTDEKGEYRLPNLPPGNYTLSGELEGFSVYTREGVYLRAGANFQVDMTLTLGGMSETLTVTAESPMLEVTSPSNVLNLDGEFQRDLPISEGKYLERLPPDDARGLVASAQRRKRPAKLLRQRRRPPGRGVADGRIRRLQLQRLQHQPDGAQHRGHRGHSGQDRRSRRGRANGLRARGQRRQQERRRQLLGLGGLDVPALLLERRQHRRRRDPRHPVGQPGGFLVRRPHREGESVVLRGGALAEEWLELLSHPGAGRYAEGGLQHPGARTTTLSTASSRG